MTGEVIRSLREQKGRNENDNIEAYNFYGACWEQNKIPPRIRPFADEILAYADVGPPTTRLATLADELLIARSTCTTRLDAASR
jgi:hypothetical protein